jgi:hypothetical protein
MQEARICRASNKLGRKTAYGISTVSITWMTPLVA